MVVEPGRMLIGTHRFTAIVSPQCSGLEGAALMLIFGAIWLFLFRHEIRLPQALALVPAGVLVLFLLNAVRIAVLIAIGNAGAREIAVRGFHSQAGWIAFNSVALGFSVVARRAPWISTRGSAPVATEEEDYPAAPYLFPFLAILAAAMISQAASGGFEWLYSLRFIAALGCLWAFRRKYAGLDWKFGWLGPAIGVLVFVLWIALDRFSGASHGDSRMPAALADASRGVRTLWIALRALAAVVTVPLAEELAFRGFLLRRLVSADFEAVSFRTFTWVALFASSFVFGLLHGDRWLAGTIAGLLYALASLRRGRLGEAVAAHATTNALLAVWVLTLQNWNLW
jgi:exosortase E/protease (VPEID-CTERM system)